MRVNIYDVARRAQVSSATVSRVLNGSPHVKETTKRRVMHAINALDYTPNALARKLSTGRTWNIGFLIPDVENPFFSQLLRGVTNTADESGYNIFLYGTDDNVAKEHRFFDVVRTERLAGILVIPVDAGNEKTCEWLCTLEAGECLLREGHRRIATIRGPESSRPGNERWMGYLAALAKWNIPQDMRYVAQGDFHRERAYAAMHELMEQDDPPTAIFAANNMTSLGCLRYFHEHGMRLGVDVSLIGFDEIEMLHYSGTALSVVDRDIYRMGQDAMHLLIRRIQERAENADDVCGRQEIFLPTNLVLRGSEKWTGV